MDDVNPYDSPDKFSSDPSGELLPWNDSKCALRGMAVGITIPIAWFAYGMVREYLFHSELEPGTVRSGTGIVVQTILLFIGLPIGAAAGAIVGRAVGSVHNARLKDR
jgi:hypothetical protein